MCAHKKAKKGVSELCGKCREAENFDRKQIRILWKIVTGRKK